MPNASSELYGESSTTVRAPQWRANSGHNGPRHCQYGTASTSARLSAGAMSGDDAIVSSANPASVSAIGHLPRPVRGQQAGDCVGDAGPQRWHTNVVVIQ